MRTLAVVFDYVAVGRKAVLAVGTGAHGGTQPFLGFVLEVAEEQQDDRYA
jgi:hypothetical protein